MICLCTLTLLFPHHLLAGTPNLAFTAFVSQDTPATYYGTIQSDPSVPNFAPVAGMTVQAFIEGVLCGMTQTQQMNDKVVYRIDVLAEDELGGTPGCGTVGRAVIFYVDNQIMTPSTIWDNSQVLSLPLHPIFATPTPTATRLTATPTASETPVIPTPTPTTEKTQENSFLPLIRQR